MGTMPPLSPTSPAVTLDAAVETVPDFIYTFDLKGKFTYANQALHKLLQLAPGEMVGHDFHELNYPEPLASTLQSQIQQVIDTGEPVRAETLFESASGAGYYEYIFVPIVAESGEITAVAGTTRDITDRKRMEEALRESQLKAEGLVSELKAEREKLQNLLTEAPAFMATLSGPEFVFEFANRNYYELIRRGPEILGKTVLEALPEVAGQGFIEILQRVFATGVPFIGRGVGIKLARSENGLEQAYIDFVYQALRDASGTITGILVHGVDVTDQFLARRDLDRLNLELEDRVQERTEQLQAAIREMEGFTYSVSHDLRSPLRAIVSSSCILLAEHGSKLDPAGTRELERQAAAANRMAALIDDLLKLSRLSRQEIRKVSVDVSEVTASLVAEISRDELPVSHNFKIMPGMQTTADAISFRLLLLNLIQNACKFSEDGKVVEIGQTPGEDGSVIWVKDQGIGVDMRFVHKLFKPFERLVTDQEFPGTGIGLANVKRIVEMHGGRVWVESEPGQGAKFSFTLGPGS